MTGKPDFLPETPHDASALLEDALRMVTVSGAVFLLGEFAEPWAFLSMSKREYADALCPGAERLVLFHVVLEGRCAVWLPSGEEALLGPGEAVVLPYCDPHAMGHPRQREPVAMSGLLPPAPWGELPIVRQGSGASTTRILCGYLRCEDLLFDPLLEALPRLIHVRPVTQSSAEWFRATARYALEQSNRRTAGVSGRLPELLLVEALRQYISTLPAARTGWLAALRDPIVSYALRLLHRSPAESWTVPLLARRAAVSRTVLAQRFTAVLRRPPMRYLAQWRLQLAAQLLRTSAETVPQIAARVGYTSEAAFSRAFKRLVGEPPAQWRARSRAAVGAPRD